MQVLPVNDFFEITDNTTSQSIPQKRKPSPETNIKSRKKKNTVANKATKKMATRNTPADSHTASGSKIDDEMDMM